jgi:diguanylate cyclase (GGDEF)-like protein
MGARQAEVNSVNSLGALPRAGDTVDARRTHPLVAAGYACAAVLAVAYATSLVLRPTGRSWPFLDNWCVDAFELAVAGLCLARVRMRPPGRGVSLALGLGLLAWALGDVAWTLESRGGATPPTPSVADAFYLLIYPLAYLGVMLLIRGEIRSFRASVWLDGLVAGLGAAALCAAFVIDPILSSATGSPAAVVVDLAYPIGDLILLTLAVGALVIVPGWPRRLVVLVAGCLVMAVGDTVYLFQSAAGSYRPGTLLDATWVAALLLLSVTAWQPVGTSRRDGVVHQTSPFLPAVAAVASLGILVAGNWVHVGRLAVGLTVATLAVVGIRTVLARRELATLTRAVHAQASTDDLTGLGNRRQLMAELERRFVARSAAAGTDPGIALLMIDLDHFKEINDSFGHPTGDWLLQQIGPRLAGATRSEDLVARLGGDEFAVLLGGADAAFATTVARRITAAIAPPFVVENTSLHVGASIGIALVPEHASGPTELMRCADVAMYRAKTAHCDFDVYEPALDDGADRLQLMEDLRTAIDTDGLTLYYQPQIDLRTGRIGTIEALVRWPHPTLGMIPPDQFLPVAEDSGLMGPLTTFVLEHAIAQCAEWHAQGHRVAVAVNLSTTNLLDTGLPGQITDLLGSAGLPPDALVLEITESTVMADLARSKEVIQHLSDAGLLVSIDDFGTGFSSLAYLSDLAVGELKIDRMFTGRLSVDGSDGRNEAIIRSSIELGHSLGLRVVAEGVECPDHFDFLAAAGCDIAQGYVISFPQPPDALDFDAIDRASSPLVARAGVRIDGPVVGRAGGPGDAPVVGRAGGPGDGPVGDDLAVRRG